MRSRQMTVFLACSLFVVSCSTANARTWTDQRGRELEADFVRLKGGSVTVKRKSDGRLFDIPVNSLSDDDQVFIRKQAALFSDVEVRYKWNGDPELGASMAAEDIIVCEVLINGKVFLQISGGKIPSSGGVLVVDQPGSRGVTIKIDPQQKKTTYAGVTFTTNCVLDILEDGTLVARKEGVVATSRTAKWVSCPAELNGKSVYAFFPRD